MILHFLQIRKLDRDKVAGRTVLALAGQHLHVGVGGVRRRRRVELQDVSVGQGAFLSAGVGDQAVGDHEHVWIVVRQYGRRSSVRRGHRLPGILALGPLHGELALHFGGHQVLDPRAEGDLPGWVISGLHRGGRVHAFLVGFLQRMSQ